MWAWDRAVGQKPQKTEQHEAAPTLLLLDRDDVLRLVIALGLERHNFHVIQAGTAADPLVFCQTHSVIILVADVSSLLPHPLQTLRSIQSAKPQAKVLLISGYDRFRVEDWYPGLLTGTQFLPKPFAFGLIAKMIHVMGRTP